MKLKVRSLPLYEETDLFGSVVDYSVVRVGGLGPAAHQRVSLPVFWQFDLTTRKNTNQIWPDEIRSVDNSHCVQRGVLPCIVQLGRQLLPVY